MEKILLFHSNDFDKIKQITSRMRIPVVAVEPIFYNETLKTLSSKQLNIFQPSEPFHGTAPAESIMLFCGIAEKKMDKILFELRKSGISIDYKAILTPTNSNWRVLRLYLELEREHIAFHG